MASKSKDKVIKRYPNGATLIYYRHSANNTTKAAIGFKTGSRTDGEQFGKTHFLEHMLFHNCMGKDQLELAKINAGYNSMQNAYTAYDFVVTSFDCPNANFEKVVKVNRALLKNRKFTQEHVDREREVIRQEMFRSIDEETQSLYFALNSLLEEIPNRQISILGYEDTINAINAQDLIDHANNTFVSENLVVSVCSSLPFEEVEAVMDKHIMTAFPSKPEAEVVDTLSLYKCRQNYLLQDSNSGCSTAELDVLFRYKGNTLKNHLYYPLESFVFNGMRGRLHDYFRLQNQLCYSSAYFNLDFSTLMYKCFQVTTTPKQINEAITVLGKMLDDIRENGITKKEFMEYKNYLKNQRARRTTFYSPVDPLNLLSSYITYSDPFTSVTLKQLEDITYEQANEHIKQIFKDTNVIVNVSGEYSQKTVMSKREVFKTLGAQTKQKPYEFDLEKISGMKYFDLYSLVSTEDMTDKERYLALMIADYNRDQEMKGKKTVMQHASAADISDEYELDMDATFKVPTTKGMEL